MILNSAERWGKEGEVGLRDEVWEDVEQDD